MRLFAAHPSKLKGMESEVSVDLKTFLNSSYVIVPELSLNTDNHDEG